MDYDKLAQQYGGTTNFEDIAKKYGGSTEQPKNLPTTVEEKPKSLWQKYNAWAQGDNALKSFATGFAKGELRTAQGLGQTTLRAAEMVSGKEKGALGSTETFFKDKTALENKNMAESIGGIAEKVGEYALTAGPVTTAGNWINAMARGVKFGKATGFVQGMLRAWGKAAVEGTKTYAQEAITGGTEEGAQERAISSGIFSGLTSGILSTAAEAFRGFVNPKKVVEKVLRDTQQSLKQGDAREAYEYLLRSDPSKARAMVKSGDIILDEFGNPVFEYGLARQALNRGVVGTPDAMNATLRGNKAIVENTKKVILDNFDEAISLNNRTSEYKTALKTVIEKADDWGADVDDVREAKRLLELLEKGFRGKGTLNANNAYDLRIFIDRMGGPRMFSNQNAKITSTLSANHLKSLRTNIKTALDKNPTFKKLMEDYKFYIDATKSFEKWRLAQEASKTEGTLGIIGETTQGARLWLAQTFNTPGTASTIGQSIRGTASSKASEMFNPLE